MEKRCAPPYFSLLMLVSLVSHVTELVLNAVLAYSLYQELALRDVFFSLSAGFLILPLVVVQLLSAIFVLRQRGDSMSGGQVALKALLHTLQLGFLWRHVALLKKRALFLHRSRLWELFLLRLVFTLAGGFPLVLLQMYLLLTRVELGWSWVLYASLLSSALSCTCSVSSFLPVLGQSSEDADTVLGLTWPGSLFTWLWRLGETVSRMICLGLFASLYGQWVLLVLGLHSLVMLLCISIPQTASGQMQKSSSSRRVAFCLMTSYSYVWCYVSAGQVKTAVWYTLYYVIMFMENCTLSIVWLTKSDHSTFSSKYLLVVISTLAFLVSMACLVVYYKYFHPHTALPPDSAGAGGLGDAKDNGQSPAGCIHYPLHPTCSKKPLHPRPAQDAPTPFPAGWPSQYQCAVTSGQYYKHTINDSLLDSGSDMTSVTALGCRQQVRDRERAEGGACCQHARATLPKCGCSCRGEGDGLSIGSAHTCRSAGSGHHRRCLKTSRSDLTDTTSVLTMASGASFNLGYEGSDETQSNTVPVWLPAGESLIAKHLMAQDTALGDSALSEHAVDKDWKLRRKKNMERYRALLKQEAQRLGGDACCPDLPTVDWTSLPVTAVSTPGWEGSHQDTDSYPCCQHSPPPHSQVSSILRTRVGRGPCIGSRGGGGGGDGDGGDVGYGVHNHQTHGHRKTRRMKTSAPGSDTSCSCCHHHQQQHQQQTVAMQYYSQPDVFTISQHDETCCVPHQTGRDRQDGKQCVSDSEGLTTKHAVHHGAGRGLHKNKRSGSNNKKSRSHSADSATRDGAVDTLGPAQYTCHHHHPHREHRALSPAANRMHTADSGRQQHTPSKLQVKAIAAKSDEDVPTEPTPSVSPSQTEPIYENVSVPMLELTVTSGKTDQVSVNLTTKDNNSQLAVEGTAKDSISTKSNQNKKSVNKSHKQKILNGQAPQTLSHKNRDFSKTAREVADHSRQTDRKWPGRRDDKRDIFVGRQEAWYMCSESEDSALPPETFSSSLEDGFTVTDVDSDGSVELII